jgi:hypothetical protein
MSSKQENSEIVSRYSNKPWTRWWWFSGPIREEDITYQLDWLKDNGFGGVEIAWVYPQPDSEPGPMWLSREWSEKVAFAKRYCDRIGLACDFTFGTLWPFGGSIVPEEDASRTFQGLSKQRLRHTWEDPFVEQPGYILNHLDRNALERYSKIMGDSLKPALTGSKSSLFCDSWEIETEGLWTEGFGDAFRDAYGYSVEEYMDRLDEHPDIRYDYRKLISKFVLEEFYKPFTSICHRLGAFSRVQCHGAPVDLLAAYGSVDIPETEAILFEPYLAKLAASAAVLTGKTPVSCETFTCLYGWLPRPGPAPNIRREQVADMKLLADSLFANGVNHIIWHGMPYNPEGGVNEFYATVHVGPDSAFADEIKPFNEYMEKVCSFMRKGRAYTDVAAYLPLEDTWMANELPRGNYPPGAKYHWEMRYVKMPDELAGYHPTWVLTHFLKRGGFQNGKLKIGDAEFSTLYIDVNWLDEESLTEILRLAREGLPVCLKRPPEQPGKNKTRSFRMKLDELSFLQNVTERFRDIHSRPPLVESTSGLVPEYWCRIENERLIFFFAQPGTRKISYPMSYGQSRTEKAAGVPVILNHENTVREIELAFGPYQSILLEMNAENGGIRFHDISFLPREPIAE